MTLAGGVYTLSGDAAAIRATLNSFAVAPAPDSDVDFTLTISASSRDADGSIATTTTTQRIIVDAVAICR